MSTMITDSFQEELHEAVDLFGELEILDTDKRSRFTDKAFTQVLKDNNVAISISIIGKAVGATICLSSSCGAQASISHLFCRVSITLSS